MRRASARARHVRPFEDGPTSPRAISIATACTDRLADGARRTALVHLQRNGRIERITFDALRANAARLAHVLHGRSIRRGERVGTLLPRGPEALLAPLAALRLGCIAVPLARSLAPDALADRLRQSGCAALVTDAAGLPALAAIRERLPALRLLLCADGAGPGALSLWQEMERARDDFRPVATDGGAPAVLLYGTDEEGASRGVLHAHRALNGDLPWLEPAGHGAFLWVHADWAGRGGLWDTVLPALSRGVPILSHAEDGIEPERILARGDLRAAVLPAAMLEGMRQGRAGPRPAHLLTFDGPLGAAWHAAAQDALGAPVVEALAPPECGVIAVAGHGAPGRRVAVLGPDGAPLPAGEEGAIALRRPDPGIFLGYWQDAAATAAAFRGPWLMAGGRGTIDAEGRLHPVARPAPPTKARHAEAEHWLRQHPAVARAAVLDAGEATAIVVPDPGASPGPALAAELRDFLRARIAIDRCPRRIAFASGLPAEVAGPAGAQSLGRAIGMGGPHGSPPSP